MNNQKIKIIFFHPYSSIGGADLSIAKVINNLNNKYYSIDFICIKRKKNTVSLNSYVNIYNLNSTRSIFGILKFRKIIKENLKKNYKKIIIFSNQNFANILSFVSIIGLGNKVKIIGYERNHISELSFYFDFKDKIKKIILKTLIKLLYPKFDRIITNSKESSNDLSQFINSKVFTFYNLFKFRNIKKKRLNRNKFINILSIGRLEKQKDQITLLKAIKIVKNKVKIKLKIIGSGSQYATLKDFINNNNLRNEVKLLKENKDVSKFYLSSDLFVLSSLYEGFPNVLIESIIYNLPIISSNCKSGPREILSNSIVSNKFNIGSHRGLSNKILYFTRNKKKFYKNNLILKKNLDKYNFKKTLERYNKLFANL